MKVITILLLSFLSAPVFAQCNVTIENKLPKLEGSWKETDNALIRAQQRKRLQNTFLNTGYYAGISDADAMSEIYILVTHEICGTVTSYEETPDVIHYQSKVRNDQGQRWETKDAAEKAVQDSCDPETCWFVAILHSGNSSTWRMGSKYSSLWSVDYPRNWNCYLLVSTVGAQCQSDP